MVGVQSRRLQAVKAAEETSSPIIHPIVDKIRQFSSTPDAAIDFFTSLLHPVPHQRLRAKFALQHVYLRGCLTQMLDDFGEPAAGVSNATGAAETQYAAATTASMGKPAAVLDLSAYFPLYRHSFHHTAAPVRPASLDTAPLSPPPSPLSPPNHTLRSNVTPPTSESEQSKDIASPDHSEVDHPASAPSYSSSESDSISSMPQVGVVSHPVHFESDELAEYDAEPEPVHEQESSRRRNRAGKAGGHGWFGKLGKGLAIGGALAGAGLLISACCRR
ncbi:TPA: hypothetical protein ACH3X3_011303 [Trebouxia sp. C0006]